MTDSASAFSMRNALSSARPAGARQLGPRRAHPRCKRQIASDSAAARGRPARQPAGRGPRAANPSAATAAADGPGSRPSRRRSPLANASPLCMTHPPTACTEEARSSVTPRSDRTDTCPSTSEVTTAQIDSGHQPGAHDTRKSATRWGSSVAWVARSTWARALRVASRRRIMRCQSCSRAARSPGSGPGLASARGVARASRPRLAAGGVMDVQLPVRAPYTLTLSASLGREYITPAWFHPGPRGTSAARPRNRRNHQLLCRLSVEERPLTGPAA